MKSLNFLLMICCLIKFEAAVSQSLKDSVYFQKLNAANVTMVSVNGGNKVWTQKIGRGKIKLLLLHGGPGATHEYFENFPAYLDTSKYEIYFYDQLGSYFSDNPELKDLWEPDRLVEEVEAVRKAYNLNQFYLLGHSWGGILAIYYASKHSEHLNGLILSNNPVTSKGAFKYRQTIVKKIARQMKKELGAEQEDSIVYKRFVRIYRYGMDDTPEVFTRMDEHYNRDPKIWENSLFKKKKWNLKKEARKIKVPTLVIGGSNDFINPNDFKIQHKIIQNSELVILPDAPHFAMWSDSKSYFGAIDKFIDKTNK